MNRKHLLSDDEVLAFIVRGYHLVKPDFPEDFHRAVTRKLEDLEENPGNGILDRVPELREVYEHPALTGVLRSLLGRNYMMDGHRHWHTVAPGQKSQGWHQDGTNVRHHQVWCLLAMYYPHDVPLGMGPTVLMPGTHFSNAPTDRLQTYGNLKGQVALVVEAGTVAVAHYDIWHAGTRNRTSGTRMMLKFLFNRTEAPAAPAWNHDPDFGRDSALRWIRKQDHPAFGGSDSYKLWELRAEMWNWILGRENPAPPPGGFRLMLS